MQNFIYIDILRQVLPGPRSTDMDYILFGGFDGMKIQYNTDPIQEEKKELIDNIRFMKQRHEDRHLEVDEHFDRQPMFLAYQGNEDTLRLLGEEYNEWPLVITLAQLDKESLPQKTPQELCFNIRDSIYKWVKDLGFSGQGILSEVFWNLGESDVVILFRTPCLYPIAHILYVMRAQASKNNLFRIQSTCSHCAFRNTTDESLAKRIKVWFQKEQEATEKNEDKNKSALLTMINTARDYNHFDLVKRDQNVLFNSFMFGEWDYFGRHTLYSKEDVEQTAEFVRNQLFHYVLKGNESDREYVYRTSYSAPIIPLESAIIDKYHPENHKETGTLLSQKSEWEDGTEGETKSDVHRCIDVFLSANHKLVEVIRKLSEKRISGDLPEAQRIIESLGKTGVGLMKYLFRLKVGRFENDLYSYMIRLFHIQAEITEDYAKKIKVLGERILLLSKGQETESSKREDYVARLNSFLMEYTKDTAMLISRFQHLFSILSVSPHTFLETYGSSMRSMTASYKPVQKSSTNFRQKSIIYGI